MGYYTYYELDWEVPANMQGVPMCGHIKPTGAKFCPECGTPTSNTPDEAIGNYIEQHDEMFYAIEPDGSGSDSCKWYEHTSDMVQLSLQFPGVLFTLSGNGEDSPDFWREYHLGGLFQYTKATFSYEPFNSNELH